MKLHRRNKVVLIFFVFIFILMGCGTEDLTAYHEAVESGLDALIAEDYEEAAGHFEDAVVEAEELEEAEVTEKAAQLLLQTELFSEANQLLKVDSFDEATEKAEEVANIENGSIALTKRSNELLTNIKRIKATKEELSAAYAEVEAVLAVGDVAGLKEATVLLEKILSHEEIEEPYYMDVKVSSEVVYNSVQMALREEAAYQTKADAREQARRKEEEAAQATAASANFDSLPLGLRIHLAATLVDGRAYANDLFGYYLHSKIEGNHLIVQVHSGVGTGHPYYLIEIGANSIIPKSGVVPTGVEIYSDAAVDTTPVSKADLYKNYLDYKGDYDAGQVRVFQEDPLLSLEHYNEMRAGIE